MLCFTAVDFRRRSTTIDFKYVVTLYIKQEILYECQSIAGNPVVDTNVFRFLYQHTDFVFCPLCLMCYAKYVLTQNFILLSSAKSLNLEFLCSLKYNNLFIQSSTRNQVGLLQLKLYYVFTFVARNPKSPACSYKAQPVWTGIATLFSSHCIRQRQTVAERVLQEITRFVSSARVCCFCTNL